MFDLSVAAVVSCAFALVLNVCAWAVVKYAILKRHRPLRKYTLGSDVVLICMAIWLCIAVLPLAIIAAFTRTSEQDWTYMMSICMATTFIAILICMTTFWFMKDNIFKYSDEDNTKQYILKSLFCDILLVHCVIALAIALLSITHV